MSDLSYSNNRKLEKEYNDTLPFSSSTYIFKMTVGPEPIVIFQINFLVDMRIAPNVMDAAFVYAQSNYHMKERDTPRL